jgi:nucleoredoxin
MQSFVANFCVTFTPFLSMLKHLLYVYGFSTLTTASLLAAQAPTASLAPAYQLANDATAASPQPLHTMWEALKPDLLKLEGTTWRKYTDVSDALPPDYLVLYFSAYWCGFCRQFTPQLLEFYNAHSAQLPRVEVVLVSADRTEQDLSLYAQAYRLSFPVLALQEALRPDHPLRAYAGDGIPCLVVLDRQGRIVADSFGRSTLAEGLGAYRAAPEVLAQFADQLRTVAH